MIYTEIVLLPKDELKRFQDLLDGTVEWSHGSDALEISDKIDYVDSDIIHAVGVAFGDLWEMDVNIVNGKDKPFIDAVLFHDGCECYAWDISDNIVGEWQVVLGDDIGRAFKLEVRAEEG